MKKAIIKRITLCALTAALLVAMGCSKTKLVDAPYPPSKVYMPQASYAKQSGAGVYRVPANIYDQVVYFTVENGKVNIPVGVSRSGVHLSGDIAVGLTSAPASAADHIETLPAKSFTLPATVTIKSGETNATVIWSIDEDFLLNSLETNPDTSFGLNISITTTPDSIRSQGISSALFIISPKTMLPPSADFFSYSYNEGSKTGYVVNKSVNATSYSWDFGDGTPIVTDASPAPHEYAAAGTYTITLTAKGMSERTPVSVKTMTLTIL